MADDRMKNDDLDRDMGRAGREDKDLGQKTPGRNPEDDRSRGQRNPGQKSEPRNLDDDLDTGSAGKTGDPKR